MIFHFFQINIMECTKCHKCLPKDNFSLKNVDKKIYYLHCDKCREKAQVHKLDKKRNEKEKYDMLKKTNLIHCHCGVKYISFRTYHTLRHLNSTKHCEMMTKK
jgi:hypothetical protein